ncbi:MAG: hypothetical protein ACI8WB_000306 [Phenylobacterium sp.]
MSSRPTWLQRWVPLLIVVASIALLIPGITQPMLTISGSMDKSQLKETGIDIIVDALTGDDDKTSAPNPPPSPMKTNIKQMITGMTNMMGLGEITGEIEVYRKTRSIIGTVSDLYHSGDRLVAFLVMLFSIVIPVLKMLMILVSLLLAQQYQQQAWQQRLIKLNGILSKWSMADVFVVALIITYMAANATDGGGLLHLKSNFEAGFYYFLGYCLFSIAAIQVYQRVTASSHTGINPAPTMEQ